MNRLTYRDKDGMAMMKERGRWKSGGIERLAAYEDTGLEPEEIKDSIGWMSPVCVRCDGKTSDGVRTEKCGYPDDITKCLEQSEHIRDLLQAEQDERLVMLPVRTKETVYVVGEKRIMECFIAEAYIDDARGLEYMVSFDCDDNCDGCPFDSWRQDYSGEYSCDGAYGEGCILGSGFGKNFFLTREAAEAELAGKVGEG